MPASSDHFDATVRVLRDLLQIAIDTAAPERVIAPALPSPPAGRTVVIGGGKAAAAMAHAVENAFPGPVTGLVVTRYGHAVPCQHVEVVEAGHPVPDAVGQTAAARMLDLVSGLGPDDLVLCLISGGGSSLLSAPYPGITLAEKQALTTQLLRAGANITEMNCVRKHLSSIKGGRLALAAGGTPLVSLIISDVPGDDVSVVASGPTCADPSSCQDALAILDRYALSVPQHLRSLLEAGATETPKPGDPRLAHAKNHLIASPAKSLTAAIDHARQMGFEIENLGDLVEGEARDVAQEHARYFLNRLDTLGTPARGFLLVSGGETTVTVQGTGRGGRNMEYLLALAIALKERRDVFAIAADTDGIDGTEPDAGAVMNPTTLGRAAALDLDPKQFLANNDAWGFFSALGDLITTGPTLTNVNDFRAILYAPAAGNRR